MLNSHIIIEVSLFKIVIPFKMNKICIVFSSFFILFTSILLFLGGLIGSYYQYYCQSFTLISHFTLSVSQVTLSFIPKISHLFIICCFTLLILSLSQLMAPTTMVDHCCHLPLIVQVIRNQWSTFLATIVLFFTPKRYIIIRFDTNNTRLVDDTCDKMVIDDTVEIVVSLKNIVEDF